MTVHWSPAALDDVRSIRNLMAEHDPGAAAITLTRIRRAVETLERFPQLGKQGREDDTRELVVARTPYLVVYRPVADPIQVVRILHGARRWPPPRRG